jgi:hypothetical protein
VRHFSADAVPKFNDDEKVDDENTDDGMFCSTFYSYFDQIIFC